VNAPSWLTDVLVALLLAIACFFAWRMLVARCRERRTDYPRDAFYALCALAVAQTQAKWISTLPRLGWAALFALAAAFFAAQAVRAYGGVDGASSWRPAALDAGVALVLVYVFAAGAVPSPLSGSSAGLLVLHYHTLGLALAVALLGYAVVALDRLSAGGRASAIPAGVDPMDRPGPLPVLAPRAVEVCHIALLVTTAYAIIANLV
jgi:hypothetical protein